MSRYYSVGELPCFQLLLIERSWNERAIESAGRALLPCNMRSTRRAECNRCAGCEAGLVDRVLVEGLDSSKQGIRPASPSTRFPAERVGILRRIALPAPAPLFAFSPLAGESTQRRRATDTAAPIEEKLRQCQQSRTDRSDSGISHTTPVLPAHGLAPRLRRTTRVGRVP